MATTLLTTNIHTGDSDTVSTFDSSIDSTYKLYIFRFVELNPATNTVEFTFQANAVGASGYDETMTTTMIESVHGEGDQFGAVNYQTASDQASGTDYQRLAVDWSDHADGSGGGELWLFNPSNTTYVKHYYSTMNYYNYGVNSINTSTSGFFDTTAAIDDIQFKFSSGNFNGVIRMYGVG